MKTLNNLFLSLLILTSCGQDKLGKGSTGGTGTVRVTLQDAPANDFEKVVVHLKRVELVGVGGVHEVLSFAGASK